MGTRPKFNRTKKPPSASKIDEEIEESFPASDPPAFTGASQRVGSPKNRKPAPKPSRKLGKKRI